MFSKSVHHRQVLSRDCPATTHVTMNEHIENFLALFAKHGIDEVRQIQFFGEALEAILSTTVTELDLTGNSLGSRVIRFGK